MRYSPPQVVDIMAEPVTPAGSTPRPQRSSAIHRAVIYSLGIDISLLVLMLAISAVFIGTATMADAASTLYSPLVKPPRLLFPILAVLPPLCFLSKDVFSAVRNPEALPFARSRNSRLAIYTSRVHTHLLAFYFCSILAALCWSAPSMVMFSKLFVSAVFSIALYALGRSIPSRKMSFLVSGVLFVVMLIATQVFIVLRLEADTVRANQEVLNGVRVQPADLSGEIIPPELQ